MLKLFLILSFLCSGCTFLAVGSGVSGVLFGSFLLSKDTKKTVVLEDVTISNNINFQLFKKNRNMFHQITIHVFEGKVLCIGELDSIAKKRLALNIISSVEGVQNIFDEISVVKNPHYKITQSITDSNITIFIKLKSMFHKDTIAFSNYNIITFKNVVYLFGVARSKPELSKMLHIASHARYVKEVKNYVKIQSSP